MATKLTDIYNALNEKLDHKEMAEASQLIQKIQNSNLDTLLHGIRTPAAKYYVITSFAELLGISKDNFHSVMNQYQNYLEN